MSKSSMNKSGMGESGMNKPGRDPRLFTLFFVLFMAAVAFGIVIPILPLLARELGASPFELGIMTASWAFVQFLFAPMWGQVSDRVGRRFTLMVGISGVTLSFLLMGLADSFLGLLMARVLGGFLAAATLPSAQALAADLSGDSDRSRAMGMMGAAFGTGFIFGPILGGGLAPLGISVPFFAGAGLGLVTIVLTAIMLVEPQRSKAEQAKEEAYAETRHTLLGNIRYAVGSPSAPYYWLAFVNMFSQSTLITALAYFLTDRFGVGPFAIGMVFTLNGAFGAVIQGAAIGPITRKLGDHPTILWGLGFGVVSLVLTVSLPWFALVVPAITLTAVAMSLTRPTVASALSKTTALPQGVTMGIQSSFDSFGRVAGPLWAGFTYQIMDSAPFLSAALVYLIAMIYMWNLTVRLRARENALRSNP